MCKMFWQDLYVYRHLLPHSDAHRQGITLASPRNSYVMKMPKERVSERTMGAKRQRVMKTPPIPKPRPKDGHDQIYWQR